MRAAEQLAKVNPLGIRTVVSVCEEKIEARGEGITYVQIPIRDAHPVPFETIDQVISAIARNIAAGPVLIHCAGGMSRSPIMTAIYLTSSDGGLLTRGCVSWV
jgi:protein-tyrosine phosphatase